jgi:hypothetical protein
VGAARALTGRERCADRLNSNEIYFLIFMLTILSDVIQCIYPIDGIPNGVNLMKANKYIYLHVLQGDYGYGHGWEDLCASESRQEIRSDLKAYRENEGGCYRIIQRRKLNDKPKGVAFLPYGNDVKYLLRAMRERRRDYKNGTLDSITFRREHRMIIKQAEEWGLTDELIQLVEAEGRK